MNYRYLVIYSCAIEYIHILLLVILRARTKQDPNHQIVAEDGFRQFKNSFRGLIDISGCRFSGFMNVAQRIKIFFLDKTIYNRLIYFLFSQIFSSLLTHGDNNISSQATVVDHGFFAVERHG
ncbi:MAG: hypothetical protein C0631_17150 [Sedimenticola sp.]|nr:MAG: hypothetical protein C0631_17150 [Sedimenticola sp.]